MLHASSFQQHVRYSSCGFGSHNCVLDGLNKVNITQDKTWNCTCWVPTHLDLGWFSSGVIKCQDFWNITIQITGILLYGM